MKLAVALLVPLTALSLVASAQMRPVDGAAVPKGILTPAPAATDGSDATPAEAPSPSQGMDAVRPQPTPDASDPTPIGIPETAPTPPPSQEATPAPPSAGEHPLPAPQDQELPQPPIQIPQVALPLSSPGDLPQPPIQMPEIALPLPSASDVPSFVPSVGELPLPLPRDQDLPRPPASAQEVAPALPPANQNAPSPLPTEGAPETANTKISDPPDPVALPSPDASAVSPSLPNVGELPLPGLRDQDLPQPLANAQEVAPPLPPANQNAPPPLPSEKAPNPGTRKVSDLPDPIGKQRPRFRPFSHVALAVKADSLGLGGELATPLARGLNLRVGASLANLGYAFNIDGINYNTGTHLKSGTGTIDWFPMHGGFHISPGVLYLETTVGGTATVPAGQYFSLGDSSYLNSIDDPVGGTASLKYSRKISPMLLIGFGNLLPRSGRHLSIPFEIGAAYTGQPVINVALAGTACTTQGCFDVATDPPTQSSLRQELTDINNRLKPFPFFPIISLGVAYRF